MEKKEKLVRTTVYLPQRIVESAKSNPEIENLSQFLAEAYDLRFDALENLTQRLRESVAEQEHIKEQIKALKEGGTMSALSSRQYWWIRRAMVRIETKDIRYVLNCFNSETASNFTVRQFRNYALKVKSGEIKSLEAHDGSRSE